MIKSEQLNELSTALSKAQSQIKAAKEDSNNPFFKSKYADLSAVWESCRKALTDNGLSVTQTMWYDNGQPTLETTLLHTSGQYIGGTQLLELKERNNPQAMGSAITYARRYGLSSIVGIVSDDDDAEGAMGRKAPVLAAPKPTDKGTVAPTPQNATASPVVNPGDIPTFKTGMEYLKWLRDETGIEYQKQLELNGFDTINKVKDWQAFAKKIISEKGESKCAMLLAAS